MFLIMRNTNISSLISLQYPNLIPKSIRTSVYFSFCFYMNNDEGIEVIVRGWLYPYLEGKNLRQKMYSYLNWTSGGGGHRLFVKDNINHKCFMVDENYNAKEIFPIYSVKDKDGSSVETKSVKEYPQNNEEDFDDIHEMDATSK